VEIDMTLRELKKQQTRQVVMDCALRLFAERGFEGVTIIEIAREANVSEATVFNYFKTKEDLIYSRMESFEQRLVTAVRERPADQSSLAAFRDCLLEPSGLLGDIDAATVQAVRTIARIITDSPALKARERQIYEEATDALARVIAQQSAMTDRDIGPWVLANALVGIHRSLVSHTRTQLLAGASVPGIRRFIRTQASHACTLLAHGLGQ
jgi:AcrR family transcriptional regulator